MIFHMETFFNEKFKCGITATQRKLQRKTEWDRNYYLPQMAMQFITLYCCMYTQICTFYAHHGGRDRRLCGNNFSHYEATFLCYDIMISLCGIRWKVEEISSASLWTMMVCGVCTSHSLCLSLLVGVNVSEKLKIREG